MTILKSNSATNRPVLQRGHYGSAPLPLKLRRFISSIFQGVHRLRQKIGKGPEEVHHASTVGGRHLIWCLEVQENTNVESNKLLFSSHSWGLGDFQDLVGNCFHLANKLKDLQTIVLLKVKTAVQCRSENFVQI